MSATLAYLALGLFAAALIWAAIGDLRRLLIPNRIVVGIIALYPIFVLAAPGPVAWMAALGLAGGIFAMGIVLFACGVAGGGDVKMLAATALWAGPDFITPFLFVTALAGGVVAIAVSRPVRAVIRRLGPLPEGSGLPSVLPAIKSGPVPYGVAIAAGGLFIAFALAGRLPDPLSIS
jgi:prepilin peptidase CpaA